MHKYTKLDIYSKTENKWMLWKPGNTITKPWWWANKVWKIKHKDLKLIDKCTSSGWIKQKSSVSAVAHLFEKRVIFYKSGPENHSDFKTKLIVVFRTSEFWFK